MVKKLQTGNQDVTQEYTQVEDLETRTFELSNGMKVEMTEPDTERVLMARDLAKTQPGNTYLFLIAECTKFNEVKLTAADIRKFRSRDYLLLEGNIRELAGEKD